ncbi:MAG: hypothetical protein LCH84_15455 [Gemmatimonadetes bacterium]|nr:hypothetical protein [Gemmatimonadota bacterium]
MRTMRCGPAALLLLTGWAPLQASLQAQPVQPAPRAEAAVVQTNAHKLRYTLAGALVGTALATAYYAVSDPADRESGCKPWSCALPYLAGSGALTGLFLSRELAIQRQANVPRLGARERATFASAPVVGAAGSIAVRDSLVAVLSDSGVTLFSAPAGASARPAALRRRAAGLGGLRQVALPATGQMLLGSASALYAGSTESGTFSRVLGGQVSALAGVAGAPTTASNGAGTTLIARGRVLHLTQAVPGAAPTVSDSLVIDAPVRAALHDASNGHWLVATDSSVVEVIAAGTTLRTGRTLVTPTPVHALAANADYIAAALDDQRLLVWSRRALGGDATNGSLLDLGSAYPYDIAFRGRDLLVAAGTEGLLRVGMEPTLNVRAVVAELAYVTLVTVDAQQRIWVYDRVRRALVEVRLPLDPKYK